jgi:hypothetical protein
MRNFRFLILIFGLLVFATSCKKDKINKNNKIPVACLSNLPDTIITQNIFDSIALKVCNPIKGYEYHLQVTRISNISEPSEYITSLDSLSYILRFSAMMTGQAYTITISIYDHAGNKIDTYAKNVFIQLKCKEFLPFGQYTISERVIREMYLQDSGIFRTDSFRYNFVSTLFNNLNPNFCDNTLEIYPYAFIPSQHLFGNTSDIDSIYCTTYKFNNLTYIGNTNIEDVFYEPIAPEIILNSENYNSFTSQRSFYSYGTTKYTIYITGERI